jgi:hypothetical protein
VIILPKHQNSEVVLFPINRLSESCGMFSADTSCL